MWQLSSTAASAQYLKSVEGFVAPELSMSTTTVSPRSTTRRFRTQGRILAVVAYIGIGLVLLGSFGQHYGLFTLAILGFGLVIVGGVGLMALSRKERLQPTGTSPSRPPEPLPAFGVPLVIEANPPIEPEPGRLADGTPFPTRHFELTAEYLTYKKEMRFAVYFRVGVYVFLLGLGCFGVVGGLWKDNLPLLGLGVWLLIFGSVLIIFIRTINRGALGLTIGPQGIEVSLDNGKGVRLDWKNPKFGIKLIEIPVEVNRLKDPPRDAPTFRFFTGPGSGVGQSPRILTNLPQECFESILASARASGLSMSRGLEGRPGTMSERRIITVIAAAR